MTVALVGNVQCPHSATGEEVIIDDRIGDPISTVGRESMPSEIHVSFGGYAGPTVCRLYPNQRTELVSIHGIGVHYNALGEVSPGGVLSYRISINSDEDAARTQPLNGDILPLSILPIPEIEVTGANARGETSYVFRFELDENSPARVVLESNREYWLTVVAETTNHFDWVESTSAGESDFWVIGNDFVWSWDGQPGFTTGRAALKFVGETLPLPGDYDRDEDVDGADFLKWQREFGSMLPRYDGSDGNGNGSVDAADYVVWRDNYGTGGSAALQAAVPEPEALSLLILALALTALRTRFERRCRTGGYELGVRVTLRQP